MASITNTTVWDLYNHALGFIVKAGQRVERIAEEVAAECKNSGQWLVESSEDELKRFEQEAEDALKKAHITKAGDEAGTAPKRPAAKKATTSAKTDPDAETR